MEKFPMRLLHRSTTSSNSLQSMEPLREYPVRAEDYELGQECGRGVSATVWRALCKPKDEVVAVKLLDLENVNSSLEEIIRETQLMRLQAHPNVLPLYCAFVDGQKLWMVMPYVSGGSVLNIMKYRYPQGLDEPVIATIMRDVLKALEYMHRHGHIHRDVKAGNILVDNNGQVYLADFGVAADMERGGSWGDKAIGRNTFVGTPCWMAPEVMEQTQGYDFLADIWSFGITLLELAHGHAPFAKYPPMKVLLMTIQNPPPQLESDTGSKHFSKAMRDIVGKCLTKDPSKRPTAAQLLEHKFFKTAHDQLYLTKTLLSHLPPVEQRVAEMRSGKGPTGATPLQNQEALAQSQVAYMQGVSSWNFDVNALKAQAALEGEFELASISENPSAPPSRSESRTDGLNGYDPVTRPTVEVPGEYVSGTSSPSGGRGKGLPPRQPSSDRLIPPTPGKESGGKAAGSSDDRPPSKASTPEPVSRPPSITGEGDMGLKDPQGVSKEEKKGRFKIVEETMEKEKGKVPGRTTSTATLGTAQGSGTLPVPASLLLAPLREMQDHIGVQYELLKELVAGIQDSERGKHGNLNILLSQLSERSGLGAPSRAEHERIKTELSHANAEVARLKQQLRVLEEELSRASRDG